MNRISRRSAAETAEALLEAGRTQPALNYDVDLGLARHHHWLRSEAPMPEWASASASTAAKSLVSVVIKTIVSVVLVGALGFAAWLARGRLQPSATDVRPSPPRAERTPADAPSARDVTSSEASITPEPIPVVQPGLPGDQPVRRAVRADAPAERATRSQRAHKDRAPARTPSARAVPRAETPDATSARGEPATPATRTPSDDLSVGRSTRREVAAAPEREPVGTAHTARPEPAPRAQVPDDLLEMQQVATAERLLERSPERALALARQGDRLFARGYFQQERAYIAIMALISLGRLEEARARAESFAKQFPALPYGARIRSALEAQEAAAPGAESR